MQILEDRARGMSIKYNRFGQRLYDEENLLPHPNYVQSRIISWVLYVIMLCVIGSSFIKASKICYKSMHTTP